ncbi:MAG TPA: toll/interleukin-1 receptor domain-containing protein [Longimicrobium sp.]
MISFAIGCIPPFLSSPMNKPVFISYARESSAGHAAALHRKLGDDLAFLDTSDIAIGDRFTDTLVDALLNARVTVILADPSYFTRWYCLLEFRVARTPFLRVAERPGSTALERDDALSGLVLALPVTGADSIIDRFPPLARVRNWPSLADPEQIAALVLRRLAANPPTLRERYATLGEEGDSRSMLLEAMRLPPAQRVGTMPLVPAVGFPESIHDEFMGRADDLWRIHDVLAAGGGILRGAALTGALEAGGGFGKTRLAVEYIYRFGIPHFPRGVFWIDAEQDVELQHYEVVKALDPTVPELAIVRMAQGGVAGVLARTIRGNVGDPPQVLFVIDNVPEPGAGTPPLPLRHWCPVLGEVAVLATSRTSLALGAGGGVVPLPLDILPVDAAVALVRNGIVSSALSDADWESIAAWVGHLPLALELLNKLVRSGGATAEELRDFTRRDQLTEDLDRAMDALRPSVPTARLRGITEAFGESYSRLTPGQQEAMRLLAWLGPDPIPIALIRPFGDVFSSTTRIALRSRSFVSGTASMDSALLGRVHRVLADYVRSQSAGPITDCDRVMSAFEQALESVSGSSGGDRWGLVGLIAPHAVAFLTRYVGVLPDETFEDGIKRVNAVAVTLQVWGFTSAAERILVLAHDAVNRRLGCDHPATLMLLGNLGSCIHSRGDLLAALQTLEDAWRGNARAFGENDPGTLTALVSLAAVYAEVGRFANAAKLQARAVAGLRAVRGEEDEVTLTALNNHALLHADMGQCERARDVQELVIGILVRLHGERAPATIVPRDNLGLVYGKLGDWIRAEQCHEIALEDATRELGEMHPDSLKVRANLAWARASLGRNAEAMEMLSSVLEARVKQVGPEHPDSLSTMSHLAILHGRAGSHDTACTLHSAVLDIRSKLFGDEHPETLRAISNLACALDDLGEYMRAVDLHERALRGRMKILGEEHPDTLLLMSNAATRHFNNGEYSAAQQYEEKILRIRRKRLGETHPETIRARKALAMTLDARGSYQKARKVWGTVLRDTRRHFGKEHEETTKAAWRMFQTLYLLGDRRAAGVLFEAELRWLLQRVPRTLSESQREIRTALVGLGFHRHSEQR